MRAGLAAVLIALALAGTASASVVFPGEKPASAVVHEAADVAVKFWQARDVRPCPQPDLYEAPSLLWQDGVDAMARAEFGGCKVWVATWLASEPRPVPNYMRVAMAQTRDETLCDALVHELGHTAGLEHDADAVMADTAEPWSCVVWARDRAKARALRTRAPKPRACGCRRSRSRKRT